jgi:hypothetical protein
MQSSGTPEEFMQLITAHVRSLPEAEKLTFRKAWLSQVAERQRARPPRYYAAEMQNGEWAVVRFTDRRFLKACGIDPDGDD